MQIADVETGQVVTSWPPRSARLYGTDERHGPFIDALCERLRAKGIGVGSTTDHVLRDLRESWQELLRELKADV